MKKKLSLLLVLAMILTLVPMSAFAASDDRVVTVPTVADDKEFTANTAPDFRIQEKDADFGAPGTIKDFRLDLTNAEWEKEMFFTDAPDFETVTRVVYAGNDKTGTIDGVTYAPAGRSYLVIEKRTDTSAKVTMHVGANRPTQEMYFLVPMIAELKGAGDAKVTVDAVNSAMSPSTYTFAVGHNGDTVATVGDAETFTRSTANVGANIIIDETVNSALKKAKTQKFRLRLPRDFEWNTTTEIKFDNNFTTAGVTSLKLNGVDATLSNGIVSLDTAQLAKADNDKRDLVVEFVLTNATAHRGTITVKPVVNVTKDADFGDVAVSLKGLLGEVADESKLVTGKYEDYAVTVKVEEVKELMAGRVDDDYITAKITVEETCAGSLVDGRTIDFELPDWVKIQNETTVGAIFTKVENATLLATDSAVEADLDTNDFSVVAKPDDTNVAKDKKVKYELEIPLTVKGTETGDIKLKVKGAGIEEQEIVVAKAIAPLEVEVKVADVKIGVQKQDAPDIIIKEVKAGAIMGNKLDGKKRSLKLAFQKESYGMNFDDATYEVIEGDLEIDQDASDVYDKYLDIVIKGESDKPSTIKVSGITMSLDRAVPEGPFNLDVEGTAVVDNYYDGGTNGTNQKYEDLTGRVARFEFANVITLANGQVATKSTFVIGDNTYKVLEGKVEVEKTMDVAAFIEDGRTFLPVKYVAESLGVASENIIWNPDTRTVTILKGDRIVSIAIDSKELTVNGVVIPMDTAAKIKDGRTVLPVSFVGKALGAQIDWDGATKTVTVEQ